MTSNVEDTRWKMKNCITLITKVIKEIQGANSWLTGIIMVEREGQCNDLEKEKIMLSCVRKNAGLRKTLPSIRKLKPNKSSSL